MKNYLFENVKSILSFALVGIMSLSMILLSVEVNAQNDTDVGIWYSTWYSNADPINETWRTGFGIGAQNSFVGDVNSDGKDDGVVFYADGKWEVALSNGNGFNTPSQWHSNLGSGSTSQMLADVDGDGDNDAIAFSQSTGTWEVALSNGSTFGTSSTWKSGHGTNSTSQFLADVDGDGKKDAIAFLGTTGVWEVALSNGTAFGASSTWKTGHGTGSTTQFLADTNNDGKEDAIVFYNTGGVWDIAESSGSSFGSVVTILNGFGQDSDTQFFIDGDDDGYADAYAVSGSEWYVRKNWKDGVYCPVDELFNTGLDIGLVDTSWNASTDFSSTQGQDQWYYKEYNGSTYVDMTWDSGAGRWKGSYDYCLVMQGSQHPDTNDSVRMWSAQNSGTIRIQGTAKKEDSNGDGVVVSIIKNGTTIWGPSTVTNTTGSSHDFTTSVSQGDAIYFVVNQNGDGAYDTTVWDPTITVEGLVETDNQRMVGNVIDDTDGREGWKASIVFDSATGEWKVQPYCFAKNQIYNLWEAWDLKDIPYVLGEYQQYDSADTDIVDAHLQELSDAGIDFLLLDCTNNIYVDEGFIWYRAKVLAERIKVWNAVPDNTPIQYALAVGGIQFSGDAQNLEWEAGEVYDTFVNSDIGGDNYYSLNGKPLIVVYQGANGRPNWEAYQGDKTNTDHFSLRWADGTSHQGYYGWAVTNGSIVDDEVMVVMPGWDNHKGNTPVLRAQGDYYSESCWNPTIQAKPDIVIINSFNEYAEDTAVEPCDTSETEYPWYNKDNEIDDFMYWDMTKEYISILKGEKWKASANYSTVQGQDQWYYQEWNGSAYVDMTWDSGAGRWKGSYDGCLIMSDKQHPHNNDSARTWLAPVTGTINIEGIVKKEDNNGDGVIVKIIKNGNVIWGPYTITDTTGSSHDFDISVSQGDSIYFTVNENGGAAYDTTIWDPIISYK